MLFICLVIRCIFKYFFNYFFSLYHTIPALGAHVLVFKQIPGDGAADAAPDRPMRHRVSFGSFAACLEGFIHG